MTAQSKYRKTLLACYLGFITQAITANFAPLLFLTFKDTYGIPLEKIALIPMVFFLTQLLIDFAATKFVDRIGYRTCVVCSQVLSAVGLALLAVLPEVLPDPFTGILIAVVLYAMGAGLIEVLISPIVEACPFDNKDGVMSLLHSFYCWAARCAVSRWASCGRVRLASLPRNAPRAARLCLPCWRWRVIWVAPSGRRWWAACPAWQTAISRRDSLLPPSFQCC